MLGESSIVNDTATLLPVLSRRQGGARAVPRLGVSAAADQMLTSSWSLCPLQCIRRQVPSLSPSQGTGDAVWKCQGLGDTAVPQHGFLDH